MIFNTLRSNGEQMNSKIDTSRRVGGPDLRPAHPERALAATAAAATA
jgi:hypothetical protein